MKIVYCRRKHDDIKRYKNTRFYWSTWYDKDKNFYYCYGFSRNNSETSTCFMENKNCTEQRFRWFFCLSPFNPLLYLLNSFFACFIPVPLITPCNNLYVCSDYNFESVLFLLTIWMHGMTFLLYRLALLTIFMTITGF